VARQLFWLLFLKIGLFFLIIWSHWSSFRIIKTENYLADCPDDGKDYTICRKISQFSKNFLLCFEAFNSGKRKGLLSCSLIGASLSLTDSICGWIQNTNINVLGFTSFGQKNICPKKHFLARWAMFTLSQWLHFVLYEPCHLAAFSSRKEALDARQLGPILKNFFMAVI
jgi:hypothetical protein